MSTPPVPLAPAPREDPHEADLARAREKVDAVVRLAGGVAHDFNNLLTVIAGNAQALLESLPADLAARTEVSEIAEAARRASTLTHQLLAFSRQLVLHPRLLDVDAVVEARWAALRAEAPAGVSLERVPEPSLGRVLADPGLLDQVITHLVRNALDATRSGGRVLVEARNVVVDDAFAAMHRPMVPGEYVLLEVSDTGIGMDTATLARAFEPFFTTKGQRHGTGMGLPTVYGIVKQSGGYLWVESTPGVGTRCRVYLPRAASPSEPARPRTPIRTDAGPGRGTVLVVEDEDLVRILTRRTLERSGYRVYEAANAAAALDLVQALGLQPDLLLTDIVMPGASGRELASAMERLFPAIAVILMSGFVDQREPLVGGGHWSFLAKPFSLDELRAKVAEAMGAPRLAL